jgi:hypothetical protein
LQYRKKFKSGGRGGARVLTDELCEPSMLVQQRNSLQQLQDNQRNWESKEITDALKGQTRLHECKNISTLITTLESKKTEKSRATYQDRGAAHFNATYSSEQSLNLAKVGLFKDQEMPFKKNVQRQAFEHHLDTVIGEKNCGRSELTRNAQLPDVRPMRHLKMSSDV